jgi:hypothetical protein
MSAIYFQITSDDVSFQLGRPATDMDDIKLSAYLGECFLTWVDRQREIEQHENDDKKMAKKIWGDNWSDKLKEFKQRKSDQIYKEEQNNAHY